MVSIVVLTLNEAYNIRACLESVAWSDNVVVVDSFSTDETQAIAASLGATVVTNSFVSFAQQRNYAMSLPCVKYDWVFHLDADERITPALRAEIERTIEAAAHSGYYAPSKMMLFGRWLKRSAGYPVYQVRLVNRREMQFIQYGHGQREGASPRGWGYLREPYIHYPFSSGFDQWVLKHNRYSAQEARQELDDTSASLRELVSPDKIMRRRALKTLAARLPGRAAVKFAYLYLLKRGFRDGSAGLTYCVLQSTYEFLISLKRRELELYARGERP